MQNWPKNEFGEILKSYPLAMSQSMLTLCTNLAQNEFGRLFDVLRLGYVAINGNSSSIPLTCSLFLRNFPCFPGKIHIVCKIDLKISLLKFGVLMPGYMTFNGYFSPISQMCTQNITILKIFPVSRKIYIVCQFDPLKMSLVLF